MNQTHTFTADTLPEQEILLRQEKCRDLLRTHSHADGMLVFSKTNIYYLTGTRAGGILWLPQEGEAVLLVRKGEERCRLESPIKHIFTFKSYASIPDICASVDSPLTACLGAEMHALPWSLAHMLQSRLSQYSFIDTSHILAQARHIKTDFERKRMRQSAQLQHFALTELFPKYMLEYIPESTAHAKPLSEYDVARHLWNVYFSLKHGGMLRYDDPHTENFLGTVAAGRNSLSPHAFGNMTGTVGVHPSMPFMGSQTSFWHENELLMTDTGFIHEGYHSQMAVAYFRGAKAHIPAALQKAHDTCLDLLERCHIYLKKDINIAEIKKYMGTSDAHTWNIHGIGLSMREYPSLSNEKHTLLTDGAMLCITIMAKTHQGQTGIKVVYEVTNKDLICLGNPTQNIICI